MDAASYIKGRVVRCTSSCAWPRCDEVLTPSLSDQALGRHRYCSESHRSLGFHRRRTLLAALKVINEELAATRRSMPVKELRQWRRAIEWEMRNYT